MNKKLILLPISLVTLGIIIGCNSVKKEDIKEIITNYFSTYISSEREPRTDIPDGTYYIDNDVAEYYVKEARSNNNIATTVNYEFHKGVITDASLLQIDASNPKNTTSLGYKYKHFSNTKGTFKLYSNSMFEEIYSDSDFTTINDQYRTDYANEVHNSIFFPTNIDGTYYVAAKAYGQVDGKTNNEFYALKSSGNTEDHIKSLINASYKSNHDNYKNSVFDTYDEMDTSIKELSQTVVPCGKYAKASSDNKSIYCYLYTADSNDSLNDSVAKIVTTLGDELTTAQKDELNKYIANYSHMGIKLVVNPTNALDLDDRVVIDNIKSNSLSFFNYFLPVFINHEMLLTLSCFGEDWCLSSCATKNNYYLLKNEFGKVLDNPVAYRSSYNYASFDYRDLGDHEDITYNAEKDTNSRYNVGFTEMKSTLTKGLYETTAFETVVGLEKGVYVYEGYLTKDVTTTAIGIIANDRKSNNYSFGYDSSYIHSNIDVHGTTITSGPSYWDKNVQAIAWPEGYSEVYIRVYITKGQGGEPKIYSESGYGMWLDFYKENSYES